MTSPSLLVEHDASLLDSAESPAGEVSASRASALRAHACSVGIMAYNEEANIANAIEAIFSQEPSRGHISELIVVASGCTDRTVEIVAALGRGDSRIRLITQERRQGKASAINLFVAEAQSPVLLMVSADVLVQEGTIDSLLRHFDDPVVGMVGGHPIPTNDETTFLGYAVHLLWRLHDRLAREAPKLGEIVAFRNVVPSIPADTAVDEISIQALITQLGYRLVYEPDGIVYNHGPSTIGDFLRQRRRIHAGHLTVRRRQGYAASTMSARHITRALRGSGSFASPRRAWWTLGTASLEAAARALGHYDALRRRQHTVWETVASTKRNLTGEEDHESQSVMVFSIVNFRRYQLEHGLHATEQLTRRVTHRVHASLAGRALVSAQRNGTIVAIVSGDRTEAERVAGDLLGDFEERPLHVVGSQSRPVKLACGIIAFSQSGQTHAGSIQPADAKALVTA